MSAETIRQTVAVPSLTVASTMPVKSVIEYIEAGCSGNAKCRFYPSMVEKSLQQIWAESERVARYLTARVGRGVNIGAFLSNTPACPSVVFGVWRSGNTLVSLPYPGRGANLETYIGQIATMCKLADAGLVLVDADYVNMLPAMPMDVATYQELIEAGGPVADTDGSGGLIQFTSGSTGTPKGVVLSPHALGANIQSIIDLIGVEKGDSACSWLPLSHDMGFVGMFLTVFSGAAPEYGGDTILLQTPESFLADPASWLRNCSDVGAMLTTETFADVGLSSKAICPAYGMAEASLAVTLVSDKEDWHDVAFDKRELAGGRVVLATAETPAEDVTTYVSNGKPLPRMEVRVVDEDGADTSDVGDVLIRGASMLTAYMGAELQLRDGDWFPTRDRGFLLDNELYLVGRSDESIIVGGENYYAADIEHAVEHPLIRKGNLAAVPLVEGGYWLIGEPLGNPTAEQLQKACREIAISAARNAGIRPAMVGFIERGRLPKTPSGKIQRLRLRSFIQNGDLDLAVSVPPRD
jgi:acyl-CoA synthetase (AMP-forming)/AMP-acid ligase II